MLIKSPICDYHRGMDSATACAQERDRVFAGDGEMAARMRAVDWARTPLGPVESWPQSLKTIVRIMLTSRYAMWMGWGHEFTFFYNDAYRPTLGIKHGWALGASARQVWAEIWRDIGPRAEHVIATGEATWDQGLLLFLERRGYPEETYHTFSYSPVPDDQGGVGGLLCVVTEDTERTIGERRLATLRALAAATSAAKTAERACQEAVAALADNPQDLPLLRLYLSDGAAAPPRLVAHRGTTPVEDEPWPFEEVRARRAPVTLRALGVQLGRPIRSGPWPEPVDTAVVLPLQLAGQAERLAGFLVAGVSPRLPFDDRYRGFLDLVAGQVASALNEARAAEAERRRIEQLAELDRAKSVFFANVSHEFRTPLTLLLGPIADLLSAPDGEVSDDARSLLALAQRNGQRLQKLVNALLDFSRIEAGGVQAVYEPVDLAAYTADLASMFRAAVEKAGMALIIDCPPLPQPVPVDRGMWEKIVLNLVSNAFKYTLAGSIRVSLRAEPDHALLTVQDTGVGIPAPELQRLFRRFHRVPSTRGRTHEGTGIGLALVQELVKLHEGSVSVESTEGQGSTFRVRVPLHRAVAAAEPRPAPSAVSAGAAALLAEALSWLPDEASREPAVAEERRRVLLADDNKDMREYVRRLLARRYEVTAVEDGQRALEAARARRPDLILTDVMMPVLDGFGLLRALRADPATAAIPIIMLSARAGEEARVGGLDAGADDYLIKPFSSQELLARVSGALALADLRRHSEQQAREADRRKDEFLATLAHELRNPLAPLRTGIALLQRAIADPAVARSTLAMMERQLGHMVRLIDDLLDVARISRGVLELQRRPHPIGAIIAGAVEAARPFLDRAGHALILHIGDGELLVDADPTRLIQVLGNLLHNAAKYTPAGGRIELRAGAEGGELVLRLSDNGVGIAAEALPRVFDMFAQESGARARSQGGLGIGLALTRRLVEMHGGTIAAESPGPGCGSTFTVRLPHLGGDRRASRPPRPAEPESAAGGLRVLVVDDNVDAAETLAQMLQLLGHRTWVAHRGAAALEVAQEARPELVFLDIGMPDLSGYEVAVRLRQDAATREAVLVALTGWNSEDDRRRSREAGFDHHLSKPVDPGLVEALLRRGEGATRGAAPGRG